MAKRKQVAPKFQVGNEMPERLKYPKGRNYSLTEWFDPADLVDESDAQYRGDMVKHKDDVMQAMAFWKARKRLRIARIEYLATIPVRPVDAELGEWLSAHGITRSLEQALPENQDRTFYEELGLKKP